MQRSKRWFWIGFLGLAAACADPPPQECPTLPPGGETPTLEAETPTAAPETPTELPATPTERPETPTLEPSATPSEPDTACPDCTECPTCGTPCASETPAIDADGDRYPASEDCDDSDPLVHPGYPEQAYDGRDNDCSPVTPDDDLDGDGYDHQSDCDDLEASSHPSASEVCDGLDNDCDAQVDEDAGSLWYLDGDGDGYGDEAVAQLDCDGFHRYVNQAGDCDDLNADAFPGGLEACDGADNDCDGGIDEGLAKTWYADRDQDGYGDPARVTSSCAQPAGSVAGGEDCDDTLPAVHPGATEGCNGLDDDCDGLTDDEDSSVTGTTAYYADGDGDGHGEATATQACVRGEGFVTVGDDCVDTNPLIFPGAGELCNGVDDDCDGLTDDEDPEVRLQRTFYADQDGDGFGDGTALKEACEQPKGFVAGAGDCDDRSGEVFPGALEVCNGVDDDCDGLTDDGDPDRLGASDWFADADGDGYGDPDSLIQACVAPQGTVSVGGDCDDSDPSLNPETVWYVDRDGDGVGSTWQVLTQCEAPTGFVEKAGDCEDLDAAIFPTAQEVCNGLDDDCDGLTDDADSPVSGTTTFYADSDGDGYGNAASSLEACVAPLGYVIGGASMDCDDSSADVAPGADEQWYDGVDNDCDGQDDPDACLSLPPATTTSVTNTCTVTPPGSFQPVVEWSIPTFKEAPTLDDIYAVPVVGQLTDDNGDGVIDRSDIPDIAVVSNDENTANFEAAIRLISGDGSKIHWTKTSQIWSGLSYAPYRYSGVSLGDIDQDGSPDIVGTVTRASLCYVAAYERTGAFKWVHTVTTVGCRDNMPALHDLEGDGDVEVVVGRLILNGSNGSAQGVGTGGVGQANVYANGGAHAFGMDLNGDGKLEVVAGSSIYDATGKTVCNTGYDDGYPAAADLDGDGQGEIVVSGNSYVRLFEANCTLIKAWSNAGGGYGGPPTVADFDGDGKPEIGVAGGTSYVVYEVDGKTLWSKPVVDASSNSTGSSVFDFQGDGKAEVVYADETRLWVFDGKTGAVLLENTVHKSGTVNEYPTIADVDGDGKAEIAVVNSGSATGLYVMGDAADGWVSARQVWNQSAYYITNVNDDLSIPRTVTPSWPTYNTFRQGAPGSQTPRAASNLLPVVYPLCDCCCGDLMVLVVQVENQGLIRAPADTILAIYGEKADGSRVLIDETVLGVPLESGEVTAAFDFPLEVDELPGVVSLVVIVDDDKGASECNEVDNVVSVPLGLNQE